MRYLYVQTGSSLINVRTSPIHKLLTLFASPSGASDGPTLPSDHNMIALLHDLISNLNTSTLNPKLFKHHDYITAIHEGIQKTKAQLPQAFLPSIGVASVKDGYDNISDPSLLNVFILNFQTLQQPNKIWIIGSRRTTSLKAKWYEPSDTGPIRPPPQRSPEIAWPPKFDVFQANVAKVSANITEAYGSVNYYYQYHFKKDGASWGHTHQSRLVYDFATEPNPGQVERVALVSGDTDKVLPFTPTPSRPRIGTDTS